MPPTPLPVSTPPSLPSNPSIPPSPVPSLPASPISPPITVPSPSIGTSPPALPQGEKPCLAQPQQQRGPSRPEDTHPPQPPQQREPSSPSLQRSHQACKQRSMLNMDPSKKSFASIPALDLTEDTSLPINPHLYHHLLTELGITDIQACKASLSEPDTLTYDQVLLDPDIEEWKKNAHKEITQLESKDTCVEGPTSEATSKILPGTWVFCCKRAVTGINPNFKARYCARGDLQEDIPETYGPVVSWSTIRLVLVFTLTQKWHLICVDFNNAFVQADFKDPVSIHLPRRYKSKSTNEFSVPYIFRCKYIVIMLTTLCSTFSYE